MATTLSNLIPLVFVLCLVLERLFPARPLPKVRFWLVKGFVFFGLIGGINALVPALVGPRLGALTLVHSARFGLFGSALVGLLVAELLVYRVHRAMHRAPRLWRWTHQMHHSAERLDIAGAAYFHPLDVTANVLTSSVAVALVGADADAAALAGFGTFLMAMFQHLNVKTPSFVGYVVQRPEGHSVHHQRGLHAYNYGNLALWDLVFGTFQNPTDFVEKAGFWDGASARVFPMLGGRDVMVAPGARVAPRTLPGDAQPPAFVP
jgi:sterol desaturase/sphingolipid hydroxylase (fatty acid hydroxylase superfamily)